VLEWEAARLRRLNGSLLTANVRLRAFVELWQAQDADDAPLTRSGDERLRELARALLARTPGPG
jgi:hypothetical protein